MEQFIINLSPNYQLDNYRISDDNVVFEISSKVKEVNCPYCDMPSTKVHSCYIREIQDLPMQNKTVVL
jgi:transposase